MNQIHSCRIIGTERTPHVAQFRVFLLQMRNLCSKRASDLPKVSGCSGSTIELTYVKIPAQGTSVLCTVHHRAAWTISQGQPHIQESWSDLLVPRPQHHGPCPLHPHHSLHRGLVCIPCPWENASDGCKVRLFVPLDKRCRRKEAHLSLSGRLQRVFMWVFWRLKPSPASLHCYRTGNNSYFPTDIHV